MGLTDFDFGKVMLFEQSKPERNIDRQIGLTSNFEYRPQVVPGYGEGKFSGHPPCKISSDG